MRVAATPSLEALMGEILGDARRGGPTPWGWHRWNDLLQCPRKYDLLYNRGQQPDMRSNALEFGGLLHECLAMYYEEVKAFLFEQNDALANQRWDAFCTKPAWQELLDTITSRGGESFLDVVDDVRRIMTAYVQFYPMLRDPFLRYNIECIEEPIEVAGAFNFTTRADLVYRSEAGLWIVDHKTSRMLTEDLVSGWSINGQMLGLAYAALQHWPEESIRGLVINIIVRTKIPQFKRVTVPLREDLVTAWSGYMRVWAQDVMPMYEKFGWPPNYASCIHRYGRCPFYGECEDASSQLEAQGEPEEDVVSVEDYAAIWEA